MYAQTVIHAQRLFPAAAHAVEGNTLARMHFIHQHGRNHRCVRIAHGSLPGGAWHTTGIHYPNAFLNLVFLAGCSAGRNCHNEAVVAAMLQQLGAWQAPVVWAMPARLLTGTIASRLEAHGFAPEEGVQEMAMDLDKLPSAQPLSKGLTIERVASSEQLRHFLDVLAADHPAAPGVLAQWQAFERSLGTAAHSCWQRYLGLLDGEPVATAAMFLSGRTAGIYHVATAPAARGRGIATALTWHALAAARRRGHTVGTLMATPQGVGVYERLGFSALAHVQCYVRQAWN